MSHMFDAAIWVIALIGVLLAVITLVVCGVVVPRSALRDMRQERDYYREAAQSCANAVTHHQTQVHELLDLIQKLENQK